MYDILRTVTDRFSLRDLIRHHTPQNGRRYDLASVRAAITDPRTVKLMESGQLFGFFGHGQRAEHYQKTGDLVLDPHRTKTVNGNDVIPASRTVSIKLIGDEIEHVQHILDTPAGHIVDKMDRSSAGGWSWATVGRQLANGAAKVAGFAGFDFVSQPNFIGKARDNMRSMMLESAPDRAGEPQLFQHPDRHQVLLMEDGGFNWATYQHHQRQRPTYSSNGRAPHFF